MSAPRKILFIGYAAIGDLIFLLPVLEGLRANYPDAKITFLANPYPTTKELIPATGLVDDVWLVDWEGGADRGAVNGRIAAAGFDLAVLSAAAPAHFFAHGLKSIPVRAGHLRPVEGNILQRFRRGWATGEFARRRLLNRPAGLSPAHSLRRNLKLLEALGLEAPKDPRPRLPIGEEDRKKAAELLGPKAGPRVGVHLGEPNNQYGKMWAPEKFAALCKTAKAQCVLVGAAAEGESATKALAAFPGFKSIVGKTSLLESFAALETCDLFLSNDTGLAKAAMALGVPTATFYGPSDPAEYGVIWEPEKHLEIRTGIECSPCSRLGMARPGRLNYLTCGHHDCLAQLDVPFARGKLAVKFPTLWP
jgi:ADP-heptose:LPS heptosyltransferase